MEGVEGENNKRGKEWGEKGKLGGGGNREGGTVS